MHVSASDLGTTRVTIMDISPSVFRTWDSRACRLLKSIFFFAQNTEISLTEAAF